MWYGFLNIFFIVFHTALTLFNVFGWLVPRVRKLNLVTLLLTAGSWFILGIWYGWGYCFCTDWHWAVRQHLGYHDVSYSYIHFLLLELTGINFRPSLVDTVTAIVFFVSVTGSLVMNIRDYRRSHRQR